MIAERNSGQQSVVVLVHGLASAPLVLMPIARRLSRGGFGRTINWSYPSITRTISDHGDRLRKLLEQLEQDENVDAIYLVTHSMGGILARHALADRPQLSKLQRVLMLCPPNRGSRVAANLSWVVGWLCTPLRQLSDDPGSFVNRLPDTLPYEVGVVAAKRDRVVAVERTDLPDSAAHVVLPAGHTSILFTRRLWNCVESFLEHGQFA